MISGPQNTKDATTDDRWIAVRVSEACKQQPLVITAVSARIQELLSAELSEKPAGAARLSAIANDLIADMSPPKTEASE